MPAGGLSCKGKAVPLLPKEGCRRNSGAIPILKGKKGGLHHVLGSWQFRRRRDKNSTNYLGERTAGRTFESGELHGWYLGERKKGPSSKVAGRWASKEVGYEGN